MAKNKKKTVPVCVDDEEANPTFRNTNVSCTLEKQQLMLL